MERKTVRQRAFAFALAMRMHSVCAYDRAYARTHARTHMHAPMRMRIRSRIRTHAYERICTRICEHACAFANDNASAFASESHAIALTNSACDSLAIAKRIR